MARLVSRFWCHVRCNAVAARLVTDIPPSALHVVGAWRVRSDGIPLPVGDRSATMPGSWMFSGLNDMPSGKSGSGGIDVTDLSVLPSHDRNSEIRRDTHPENLADRASYCECSGMCPMSSLFVRCEVWHIPLMVYRRSSTVQWSVLNTTTRNKTEALSSPLVPSIGPWASNGRRVRFLPTQGQDNCNYTEAR